MPEDQQLNKDPMDSRRRREEEQQTYCKIIWSLPFSPTPTPNPFSLFFSRQIFKLAERRQACSLCSLNTLSTGSRNLPCHRWGIALRQHHQHRPFSAAFINPLASDYLKLPQHGARRVNGILMCQLDTPDNQHCMLC
jgi:hypothetical protein